MEWVYDRTQADVERVKALNDKYAAGTISEEEKREWAAGMKGALNAADLNRIESNIREIAEALAVSVTVKMWGADQIPRASDFKRIRDNVQRIREAWSALKDTPATPDPPLTTYQKWNAIERILHDVKCVYDRVMGSYYYCGDEIYAGEGIGIL
jgi:hypothetical protein